MSAFTWTEFIRAVANHKFAYAWMAECIVAQSIIESGRGVTELSKGHGNFNGMKYRETLAKYGGKKYQYFTDSEPFRDANGKEVPEGTPGAKRWDWFFIFSYYEDAIKTWENWYFRTDGDWTPYPKVAAKDPSVLKDTASFLAYIGPIYCPYFEKSHGETYANYIVNKCIPEARQKLKEAKPGPNPPPVDQEVTWFRWYNRGANLGIVALDSKGAARALWEGSDLKSLVSFASQYKNANDMRPADGNPWPTELPPVEPPKPGKGKRIYLDPGHSPSKSGADGGPGVHEEVQNLLACKLMQADFEKAGHTVYWINPDPDNLDQVGNAAKGYDAAFCLHHNAYDGKQHYVRTYLASNPKQADIDCSNMITAAISKAIGIPDEHYEKSGFTVPNLFEKVCTGPSCLIEFYFIDAIKTVDEANKLTTAAAHAAASAIIAYLK